jgi:transglutaminase-like putative cysteine protease
VAGQVRIDVRMWDYVSFAMAHNSIEFVKGVKISGLPDDQEIVSVSIALTDRGVPLSRPWKADYLVQAGEVADFTPKVELEPAAIWAVEEDRTGELTVRVSAGDEVLGETKRTISVVSPRSWRFLEDQPELTHELLGSYVMPNDPTITALVAEARTLLEQRTGSSATQGYQAGEKRVDEVVEAIWDAARSRDIAYSNPPASWTHEQKIRTPEEVLIGRAGTCLDTTVVLAAALESVGINSTLWLLRGHAFLGYWREALDDFTPMNTGMPATVDASGLKNLIDIGALRILETTRVAGGASSATFGHEDHRKAVITHLSGDLSQVDGVVDVYACRRSQILPLPATRHRADGVVEVVEYRPETHSGQHFVAGSAPAADQAGVDARGRAIPPRVQRWKNSLLDLSLRNKLINFTETGTVALAVPDGALPHVEDLLNAGKPITLLPSDGHDHIQRARGVQFGAHLPQDQLHEFLDKGQMFTPVGSDGYLTRFRSLAYKAKTIVEETGANNLYLALGSLNWSVVPKQGGPRRAVRSPLILVPVTLSAGRRGGPYQLVLDEAGASTPNFCLIEKLRQEEKLSIPGLESPVEDEHGIDLAATFASVRTALAENGLDFHVDETADLAILQFAKFRLWKDLDESWEQLTAAPLVRHMIETPGTDYLDPAADAELGDLDDLDAACPIPADGSQLEAIAAAVAGKTFVLEGPPGTGKSQTITNLLARAIAGGKRVLFVAEKRAALDVVSARLAAIGLSPFCLDLHDKSSKPAGVRAQILQALDLAPLTDEQGFSVQQQDLAASARALDLYARRLHEKNSAGLSFYSARTQALALGEETPALPVPIDALIHLTPDVTANLRHLLGRLNETADLAVPRPHHPWGFVRRPGVAVDELKAAVRRADTAAQRLAQVPGALGTALAAASSPEDVHLLHKVMTGPAVGLRDLDEVRTRTWSDRRAQYEQVLASFTASAHPGLDRADPMALNLPLDQLRADVAAAVDSGFFGRKKRILAAVAPLTPYLSAVPKRKEALPLVDALLETRSRAGKLSPAVYLLPGLRAPASWNPWDPATQQQLQGQIAWLLSIASAIDPEGASANAYTAALRSFIDADVMASPDVIADVAEFALALDQVAQAAPGADVADWLGGAPLLGTWSDGSAARESGPEHSRSLTRWLNHLQALEPLREVNLDEAAAQLRDGVVPAHLAAKAFERGIAEASLVERRGATGLDVFDAGAHNMSVARFGVSSESVRDHLRSVIPAQIVAARPFSATAERGQVNDLRRQLGRQRGGMKVRALLDTYGELITQLMPCVLVSPDSVARFFPVGSQTFDLVVFDEASQIRVADAVGVIGRAKAVVIVGDSKQMPPTSVAESVVDDEEVVQQLDGVGPVADDESILTEAISTGLASHSLTWHYRSRDEALIAFSNEHYYENKLSSFPTPPPEVDSHGRPTAGLSFVRVPGTFLRSGAGKSLRTNSEEAGEIVAEIRRRFALSPDRLPSIGVVTFNAQQRTLIESLLRDAGDERIVEALDGTNGEGLFVKNLENVQGDERDVILFSVAFSKNEKGILPLNFGPLGLDRGERRLNVAVTRARQQVIIYCSFDPSELRADDTKHLGIKHLKNYLELAQRGTEVLTGTASRGVVDRHREELAAALRTRGLVATTDLGLSDFKIDLALAAETAPDAPVVAVLLDGEGWARRRTVGDRDGLPVVVLGKMMGWQAVERVWLPEWLRDREAVLDRLVDAVRRARSGEPAPVLVPEPTPAPAISSPTTRATGAIPTGGPETVTYSSAPAATEQKLTALPDALDGASPYRRWTPEPAGDIGWLDNLQDPRARSHVSNVIATILQTESPVLLKRLGKLTANAFGLSRVTPARIQAITALVPAAQRDSFGFAWHDSADIGTYTRFRTAPSDEPRVLDEIHPLEVVNAMVAISRSAWGIRQDDLYAETLAQFGWKRRTAAAVALLSTTLEGALRDQLLLRSDNGLIRAL